MAHANTILPQYSSKLSHATMQSITYFVIGWVCSERKPQILLSHVLLGRASLSGSQATIKLLLLGQYTSLRVWFMYNPNSSTPNGLNTLVWKWFTRMYTSWTYNYKLPITAPYLILKFHREAVTGNTIKVALSRFHKSHGNLHITEADIYQVVYW